MIQQSVISLCSLDFIADTSSNQRMRRLLQGLREGVGVGAEARSVGVEVVEVESDTGLSVDEIGVVTVERVVGVMAGVVIDESGVVSVGVTASVPGVEELGGVDGSAGVVDASWSEVEEATGVGVGNSEVAEGVGTGEDGVEISVVDDTGQGTAIMALSK